MKKKAKKKIPNFKKAYLDAMKIAKKTPGFPSKDKLVIDLDADGNVCTGMGDPKPESTEMT